MLHKNCMKKGCRYTFCIDIVSQTFHSDILNRAPRKDWSHLRSPMQAQESAGSAASTDSSGRRSLKRCAVRALSKIKGLIEGHFLGSSYIMLYLYVYLHVYVYIYMYTYIYIKSTHILLRINVNRCLCIQVNLCKCLYIYIFVYM